MPEQTGQLDLSAKNIAKAVYENQKNEIANGGYDVEKGSADDWWSQMYNARFSAYHSDNSAEIAGEFRAGLEAALRDPDSDILTMASDMADAGAKNEDIMSAIVAEAAGILSKKIKEEAAEDEYNKRGGEAHQQNLIETIRAPLDAVVGAITDALDALDSEEPEETSSTNIKFKEQCFLLSNILDFANLKKRLDDEKNPKTLPSMTPARNSSLMVHGDPFGLINALTQSPNKETFFNMPVQSISALQPLIRLFKIVSEDGEEYQVELKFDSHRTNLESAFGNSRNHGVGLKSFDFSYEANNPYAIKKSIKAKLVLFANSFSDLLEERRDSAAIYRYIDLALKTGGQETYGKNKTNPQLRDVVLKNLEKLNFRLKAVVGWANPAGSGRTTDLVLSAVYDSCITLNLTPTVHHFDIDDFGRVTFTINYLAYIEDFFDQPSYNIFSDFDTLISQIKRRVKYRAMGEYCASGSAAIAELKNSPEEIKKIEEEKITNKQSLIDNMLVEKKIRFFKMSLSDMNNYRAGGPFKKASASALEKLYNETETVLGDIFFEPDPNPDDPGDDSENPVDYYDNNVSFFYAGDLIDVILKYIGILLPKVGAELGVREHHTSESVGAGALENYEFTYLYEEAHNYANYNRNFNKFRLLLGPLELVDTNTEGEAIQFGLVNLGDIPISVKYFMEWLTEKMLKPEKVAYTLPNFLNDFFNGLIRDFLNNDTCYGNRAKQKTRLSQTSITAYRESETAEDAITTLCKAAAVTRLNVDTFPKDKRPILNIMGHRGDPRPEAGLEKETNYLIYFAARTQPTDIMKGDLAADHARGIWHYQIGKNKGIVKTIKLSKTSSPGLAEVRFEQEGYDGLQQLRVMYDASIKTFLDVTAYPGAYIFIEPKGFDPGMIVGDLTKFGIGGYHMIIRTAHTLGPGLAETEITAKWVAEIDAQEASAVAGKAEEPEPANLSKCYSEKEDNKRSELAGTETVTATPTSAPQESYWAIVGSKV